MRLALVLVLTGPLLAGAAGSWGCGNHYSQANPDDVLASARAMVENNDVHRLPDLFYAESKEMRRLLTQSGSVLRSLQALALELHRAFPEEIAAIRAQAEEAAQRGDATGFVGRMIGGQRGGAPMRIGRRGNQRTVEVGTSPGDRRQAFNDSMKELFADPYGWLERSEGRLSTQYIADDMAAIMWDGKPAFGVGMLMKEEAGKWYLMLPTTFPGSGQLFPSTPEMWEIAGSLIVALDNAIKDTHREVRAGKHRSLQDLSHSVGEKAALPAMAIMYAYQRALQVERQEQRERAQQAREAAQGDQPAGGGS
jgi:hypothetical protein